MKNKNFKFVVLTTLFFLCLNIFCLSSCCAYADIANTDLSSSSSISDADSHANAENDDCSFCNGHCCLSQLVCFNHPPHLMIPESSEQFAPLKPVFLQSIVLKSVPKPPSSHSLA